MITKYTGLKRIFFAGLNSFKGISHCLKYESAFRQEVLFSVILFPVIYFSNISKIEVILLVASLVIILITELLNTAIEAAIDRISSEYHELSGIAKDVASAAVSISLGFGAFVWLYILIL